VKNQKKDEAPSSNLPAGIQYDNRYKTAQNPDDTATVAVNQNANISDLQNMLSKLQKNK